MRIGIIGAGPTGSLLAVHLLKAGRQGLDIVLIDGRAEVGYGAAFSTNNSQHLLNVRASNMSAFEEDPPHFLRWLWARDSAETNFTGTPPSGQAFVSRYIYGDYIASLLKETMETASPGNLVTVVQQDAVDVHQGDANQIVTLADARTLYFDRVVLCLGNFPPAHPSYVAPEVLRSPQYLANPWDGAALRRIPPTDSVLVLGTGLTMVDVIQSLRRQNHTGRIRAISRHGLLPLSHDHARPYRALPKLSERAQSVRRLLQVIRSEIKKAEAAGYGWRSVLDAVRAQMADVWQVLSFDERRRFLRHLRPYWEVHRHRLAPQVAAYVKQLQTMGHLRVQAARTQFICLEEGKFDVAFTPRGQTRVIREKPQWIVNCSGPQCDYENTSNSLVEQLLARGFARPDALRLGLDVTSDNRVINANGQASVALFAVGPPTRGTFWESTAIPDIRQACARVAQLLLT